MTKMFNGRGVFYALPNGERKTMGLMLPVEVEEAYRDLHIDGCQIEAEQLTTGEYSVTLTHEEHGDLDIVIATDGKGAFEGIVTMLKRDDWREQLSAALHPENQEDDDG